jgi:putative membrane protein
VKLVKLVVGFMLLGLGASFASLNAGTVRLDFYFAVHDVPIALALVVALGAGALLGVLAASGRLVRLRQEAAELRRKARLSAEEISNLRALPIRDH